MANVTYSSFTSEASPQDTDQVVGYRTATVGGERRTALSVLRTFFKATYDTLYATLASPAFTGTPTAPTATGGTNTTQLATTAFVLANSGGATSVTAASTFGTDNVMLRSDGTGRGSQSSGVTVDDSNNIGGIATLSATTLTPTSITWGTIVVPVSASVPLAVQLTAASSVTIDWSLSNVFYITLGQNTTFVNSNARSGQTIQVAVLNTASNYTVTWPATEWSGGTPPTQTVGAKRDRYTFTRDAGTVIGGAVVLNMS